MPEYSFFDLLTGEISPDCVSCPVEWLERMVPTGFGAVAGHHNHSRARVVLADDGFGNALPVIAARKPAKPLDSDSVTWEWDEVADEWVANPTLAANRSALRAVRNAELQATDGVSIAALESLLQSVLATLGHPLPAATQQLLDHRDALRAMPQRPDFDSLSVADMPRYATPTRVGD
jgi:hypothetical protein